jgi:surfactin synthase thioesterase subunit
MNEGSILFCLPYAGGSARSLTNVTHRLKHVMQIRHLELPGRGNRSNEPLCTDLQVIVDDLYHTISESAEKFKKIYLWGHSMGAIVALLLACKLEKNGHNFGGLIVSAMTGPSENNNKRKLHLLPEKEFFQYFVKLMPPGMSMENDRKADIMFDRMQSVLRADIQALELLSIKDWDKMIINAPIYVLFGNDDEIMSKKDGYSSWKLHTKALLQQYVMEGGHFFVLQHAVKTACIIQHIICGDEKIVTDINTIKMLL